MKLRTKLSLYIALPSVGLMTLFAALDVWRTRASMEDELRREGKAVSKVVEIALQKSVAEHDDKGTQRIIDEVTGYERILGMRVFGPDGEVAHQSGALDAYPFTHHEALGRVLRERRLVETRRRVGEEPVITFIFPLETPEGELLGAGQVLQLESTIAADERASRRAIALLTAAVTALMCLILVVVTRMSLGRPIAEMTDRLRAVGSGDLSVRIPESRRDEFGELAREFNRMCEQLDRSQKALAAERYERRRMEERLRTADRQASVGRLAAGVAHEIGTPLNVIEGRAEILSRKLEGSQHLVRHARIIRGQIERITRIVAGMLSYARSREPSRTLTDIPAVLLRVMEFLEYEFEKSGTKTELLVSGRLPPVMADADHVHQVFLNIALNALDAMPQGGMLRISAFVQNGNGPAQAGAPLPCLAVSFEDSGEGIAPEHMERVFEAFFTTKAPGKGTGLGLSVAWNIMREHGGSIGVESTVGEGTTFTVRFPLEATSAAAPAAKEA